MPRTESQVRDNRPILTIRLPPESAARRVAANIAKLPELLPQ